MNFLNFNKAVHRWVSREFFEARWGGNPQVLVGAGTRTIRSNRSDIDIYIYTVRIITFKINDY